MREKASSPENKALEMASKYICNLRDGRCPMVLENYQCFSSCASDTQPWQCWMDHFLAVSGTRETTTTSREKDRPVTKNLFPDDRKGHAG